MSGAETTILTDIADRNGNAHLTVEYKPVDITNENIYDSNGNYQFEGSSLWRHSDFSMKHGSKTYSLGSKIFLSAPTSPRYAEVINDKAYVLAGHYKYPNSEEFEELREIVRTNQNEEARETRAQWMIAEIEKKENGEIIDVVRSPSGEQWWTYNELSRSTFVDSIISGANSDESSSSSESSSSGEDIVEISSPTKFKVKNIDKITNFNPSTDTLEIDTKSFGIDSSATFAAGKNKKTVKKKLAKQDFDFLYDQKKGGLYFNENGSVKGFGEGGIIAILKGAPDLNSDNLEFV